MSTPQQASHVHLSVQNSMQKYVSVMTSTFTPEELVTKLLRAEYLLSRAQADNVLVGKHLTDANAQLVMARIMTGREQEAHAKCRSALRKLKSQLTPAMLAHLNKLNKASEAKQRKAVKNSKIKTLIKHLKKA